MKPLYSLFLVFFLFLMPAWGQEKGRPLRAGYDWQKRFYQTDSLANHSLFPAMAESMPVWQTAQPDTLRSPALRHAPLRYAALADMRYIRPDASIAGAGASASYGGEKLKVYAAAWGGWLQYNAKDGQRADTAGFIPVPGISPYAGTKSAAIVDARVRASFKPGRYITAEAGYDRLHIGDGYRSLWLSGQARPYPYLRLQAEVWRLQYDYALLFLNDASIQGKAHSPISKYMALHTLSWNIGKRTNLQFFEGIIWEATDSAGTRGIEMNYLNPMVFMRPVEFSIGSPDNVVLGIGLKIQATLRWTLYSQFLLDEFNLTYIQLKDQWWATKYALQAGMYLTEPFRIQNLALRGEINWIRPFTYTHIHSGLNYGHHLQPLAHPRGANLAELHGAATYTWRKTALKLNFNAGRQGMAPAADSASYGGDIYKPYPQRNADFGIGMFNGQPTDYIFAKLSAAYPLWQSFPLHAILALHGRYEKCGGNTGFQPGFSIGLSSVFLRRHD